MPTYFKHFSDWYPVWYWPTTGVLIPQWNELWENLQVAMQDLLQLRTNYILQRYSLKLVIIFTMQEIPPLWISLHRYWYIDIVRYIEIIYIEMYMCVCIHIYIRMCVCRMYRIYIINRKQKVKCFLLGGIGNLEIFCVRTQKYRHDKSTGRISALPVEATRGQTFIQFLPG